MVWPGSAGLAPGLDRESRMTRNTSGGASTDAAIDDAWGAAQELLRTQPQA